MLGGERDTLRLPGFDGQRIQPEWLPAVVEPVQQPEVMSMEVEDGRLIGAICQRQHHGAAGLGAESGCSGACEVHGRHPVGLKSAKRQLKAQSALEVDLARQAIGWQRRRHRQRLAPDRRLVRDDQPGDGASLGAIVQEYG